ncbi:hypothetical protein FPRO03_13880 [Fusarium proliferatum]|nr:hypothetical protein FPRO03_13880 [Fusarium proliferatum]
MSLTTRGSVETLPTLEEVKASNEGCNVPLEAAWIWGQDDELGRLNLLTPERILRAKTTEMVDGQCVSLNWPITLPAKPAFCRDACKYKLANHPDGPVVFDDWIEMNVQSGSQWDGFRHFGHLGHGVFYNNLTPDEVTSGTRCGMQAWSHHGIVGRGVLLDYYHWKTEVKNEPYDAFTSHAIHLDELKAVAAYQKVEFQVGDILLVRSGYTATYYEYEKSAPERLVEAGTHKPHLTGLAQTEEMKTWLHDRYFSAVAGDAPSFECWPTTQNWHLHEYLLACWGVPIGEMFDLEALSVQCLQKNRWSFFFVSTPLNSPGGVASLANAMAIF